MGKCILRSLNHCTSHEFTYVDKGEVFVKADLSDMPKTKAKLKKRELAKARSKVSGCTIG